ncbi:MAG: hypothetical protein HY650_10085, partial [Acidobacteria bacterium]|nr:hypothetical protein [Acidobacteriota bacterium]
VFYLMRSLKPLQKEPEKVGELVDRFVEGTSGATAYARTEFYYGIARELLNQGILYSTAAELAGRAVALLNEQDYLENERRAHEQREAYFKTREPDRPAENFSTNQAAEKYRAFRASNYATLGRAYFRLDRFDEAQLNLKRAYEIKPIMEAAVGLADVTEKRGRDADAFEYLADAALTGRLPADGIERLHRLYRKLHEGKLEGLEEYLDDKYRKSNPGPLKVDSRQPAGKRAADPNPRIVLAEFVTGAGCEPCIAVDLAFDAGLQRYGRSELALLVYHIHAPTSDPLSNPAAQARANFYGATGAPTVYLDGRRVKVGDGLATEAGRVLKSLDAQVGEWLDAAAEARIRASVKLENSTVKVTATPGEITGGASELRLHVALVEDEVSYSGENGLRFHPMVVRDLARGQESGTQGFAIDPARPLAIEHVFDLNEISQSNLAYYDEYIADLKKRTGLEASFREKRHQINPERLSVVVFLQDATSREILQAAYLKVAPLVSGQTAAASRAESAPATQPDPSPQDEALKRLRTLRNDPVAYVEAVIRFVNDYPEDWQAESGGFWLRDAVKRTSPDVEKTRALVRRFVEGIDTVPAPLRVRFYSEAVKILLQENLAEEATELAQQGVGLLDEKAYVEYERRKHERSEAVRKARYPTTTPRAFSSAEQAERFRGFSASYYASIGRGFLMQEKLEQAAGAFGQAHEIKPDMESAVGMADIMERRGRKREALEYFTSAALTGRLKSEDITRFHALYRELNQGKLEGLEAGLDARYHKTHRNPLKDDTNPRSTKRPQRVAVVEFFTGAGCIPCIPVDYAVEKALEEYSRGELALLVYHMHAPVSDPLSNHGSDARQKYYEVNSAPTLFLDGRKFANEVDPRTVDLAVSKAGQVHAALAPLIEARIKSPARGRLSVEARRVGESIKVTVATSEIDPAAGRVTLQIVLVEEEVSYSGENGLRFHPMVVRSLARGGGAENYGFPIDPAKAVTTNHRLDLSQIVAENLRYYDEYPVERRKELSARLDKERLDRLNFSFREQRHVMNPDRLSVVAFLQDDATKAVLQTAYLDVPPAGPDPHATERR